MMKQLSTFKHQICGVAYFSDKVKWLVCGDTSVKNIRDTPVSIVSLLNRTDDEYKSQQPIVKQTQVRLENFWGARKYSARVYSGLAEV